MEVERYKMIYATKNDKDLFYQMKYDFDYEEDIKYEILDDNVRILGYDFVKNNKNKAKLIINNKKCELKEFINGEEIIDDKIKVNMILSKQLTNLSYMFQNCYKLLEFSLTDNTTNIDNEETEEFKVFVANIDFNEDICDNHDYLY